MLPNNGFPIISVSRSVSRYVQNLEEKGWGIEITVSELFQDLERFCLVLCARQI
jgi:DNA integrity scanning protein DisA with diadenylate cyclase activity